MRLNLGCGPNHFKGWTNVDKAPNGIMVESYSGPNSGVDVVADVGKLPMKDESVDEVYAGHLLEHVPFDKTHDFLIEWRRVLKPRGKITIIVPDMRKIASAYMRGNIPVDHVFFYYTLGMGDPNNLTDFNVNLPPHQQLFDQDKLFEAIVRAGFVGVCPINVLTHPLVLSRADVQCGFTAYRGDK